MKIHWFVDDKEITDEERKAIEKRNAEILAKVKETGINAYALECKIPTPVFTKD